MEVPRFWREIPSRYNLIGTRCDNCGKVFFPPRYLCPNCRRAGRPEPCQLKGRGKILSYAVIHVPPKGLEDQTPYVLATVELEEGPRLTTQITDCNPDEVKIGDEVEVVFRRINEDGDGGAIFYGYKFRPLLEKGGK